MKDPKLHPICRRITQIRTELTGQRGKSSFAQLLGLSPSTYDYYESNRVPPAKVLVEMAQVAGVDLHWLLTGQAAPETAPGAQHPVIVRAAKLLADNPAAGEPLAAFIQVLAEASKFPENPFTADSGPPDRQQPKESQAVAAARRGASRPGKAPPDVHEGWIPVLGRTAAGVAQFWSAQEDTDGLTVLNDLIKRYAQASPQRVRNVTAASQEIAPGPIQLITLTGPEDNELVEFVAAAALKARYRDAFALRIDGESMAPDIHHGDIVVLSPSVPASQGRAAVVQLARQIGVTCKLYRREQERVHLVPVNEQFEPQTYPADAVVWALRVLSCIRA